MDAIAALVNNKRFQNFIITVIIANAAILGLLTTDLSPGARQVLVLLDTLCLVIFCIEIAMKLAVMRGAFFRDGWNVFDLAVIGIALLPAAGPLAVLRALRVLRVMRLVTAVPSMRRVLNGMFAALPGGASVAGILFILYYVAAIVGTTLFGDDVPRYFGDMGTTFFTLFQLMTLEGWNSIAEAVMATNPRAWMFFVIFIVFTNFTTLNLLFGIIVDAMEAAKEEEVRDEMAEQGVAIEQISDGMRLVRIEEDLKAMHATLAEIRAGQRA